MSTDVPADGPTDTSTVAGQVRAWRAREGLSLERAGRLLGVAHTTVRDWEAGRQPGELNLARLTEVIGGQEAARAAPLTLRQARVRRGLTLQQLARQLSVSVSAVSSWELGRRRPSCCYHDEIVRLLRLTSADVTSLLPACAEGADCAKRGRTTSSTSLGRLRQARGLDRAEAARRLGISPGRLARHESGALAPDVVLCTRMARLYGCPFAVVAQAGGFRPHPLLSRRRREHADFAEVLVALRQACGLPAAAVARDLAVTPRTLRRWERGIAVPQDDAALRRAEQRFGLGAGELRRLGARAGTGGRTSVATA